MLYTLRNADEVKAFLREHPRLIQLLLEAKIVVEEFFEAIGITLQVVIDSEGTNHKQLFAYISTNLPPVEAIERLDAFNEAWFLKQIDGVGDFFNFNLESV